MGLAGNEHELSAAELAKLFHYDAATGEFYWKPPHHRAGKRAGFWLTHGYTGLSINNRRFRAHRIAWIMHYGSVADGEIDHIDGNKSNNAIANLRIATRTQNAQNTTARGYHWLAGRGYMARICVNGERIYLGCFPTEEEADRAYREAKARHHGEFSGRKKKSPPKSYPIPSYWVLS